jgi:multiple sugar transport system permease protein/cellobiose transport system permease protein
MSLDRGDGMPVFSDKGVLSGKNRKWPYLFLLPFLLAYGIFMVFPMIYSLYLSTFNWNGITQKTFVGLGNYIRLFRSDRLFLKSILNTIIIMFMSLPATLFLGLILAFCLYNIGRSRRFFQVLNFMPYFTTPVAIGFIFSYIFDWNSGILNGVLTKLGIFKEHFFWLQNPWASRTIVALMIIWRNFGYCMLIYLAGMTAISRDIYEAARIDRANQVQTLFYITIPILKPVTVFLFITALIGGFQMFDEPVQLFSGWSAAARNIGGPDYSVLTILWKFYDDAFGSSTRLGYGAAIAYSLFIIIGIFSFLSFYASRRGENT